HSIMYCSSFTDPATSEIYTLSLHDALPIWPEFDLRNRLWTIAVCRMKGDRAYEIPLADRALELVEALPRFTAGGFLFSTTAGERSEEHTSELQSQSNLVCRLLLEKKKKNTR